MINKHLFLYPELLSRLAFTRKEDGGYYVQAQTLPEQKARSARPEEIIRQLFFLSLIHHYHYPIERIQFEYVVSMGRERKRADLVVLRDDGKVEFVIEVKQVVDENSIEQLKSYLYATGANHGAVVSGNDFLCLRRLSNNIIECRDLPQFLGANPDSEESSVISDKRSTVQALPKLPFTINGLTRLSLTRTLIDIKGVKIEFANEDLLNYIKVKRSYIARGTVIVGKVSQDDWLDFIGRLLDIPITPMVGEESTSSLSKIEKCIVEMIDNSRPGFAGGWISSLALDRALKELKAETSLPQRIRKRTLEKLGYVWHPRLSCGRVNEIIPSENGKPRLYVKKGHANAQLSGGRAIIEAYLRAQKLNGPG